MSEYERERGGGGWDSREEKALLVEGFLRT